MQFLMPKEELIISPKIGKIVTTQPQTILPARSLEEAVEILNSGVSDSDRAFFLEEFTRYNVGNTPMSDLRDYVGRDIDTYGQIIVIKDESKNLEGRTDGFSGNVKVRFGLRGVLEALTIGRRTLDGDIEKPPDGITGFVEATSGSTGTAVAYFAREKGIPCVIFIPENAQSRIAEIMSLGAIVKETPAVDYMGGAIQGADNFLRDNPKFVQLKQYDNTANPAAHFDTTGREVIEQCDTSIGKFPDFIIASGGTSGTVMGTGLRLMHEAQKRGKSVGVYIVQPEDSAFHLYSGTQRIDALDEHKPLVYVKFANVVLGGIQRNTIYASNEELLDFLAAYDCNFRGGRSTALSIIGALRFAKDLKEHGETGKVIATFSPSNNSGEDYAKLTEMYRRQK